MRKNIFLFVFISFLFSLSSRVLGIANDSVYVFVSASDSVKKIQAIEFHSTPIFLSDSAKIISPVHKKENKRFLAAVLAFPFPFGMLGLHRIYLGTKPFMPFVYIGTIGGCFFILPFIDFFTILLSDDQTFKEYENNPKVFMWSH